MTAQTRKIIKEVSVHCASVSGTLSDWKLTGVKLMGYTKINKHVKRSEMITLILQPKSKQTGL